MIPYFGASVYDDPAVYAKSSAINFIKQAKTPTLVVVGDRDGECPAPQSYEFWHALRDEHVPTELVVYPNEGHGFVNPEHRRDVMDRAVEWFSKYMPAAAQREPRAADKVSSTEADLLAIRGAAESMEVQTIRGEDRTPSVLIHFSLEQIERGLSTGCMEL